MPRSLLQYVIWRGRHRERQLHYTSSGCWPVLLYSLFPILSRESPRDVVVVAIFFLHRVMYISLEGTCSSVGTPAQMWPGRKRWVNTEKSDCNWTDIATQHKEFGFSRILGQSESQDQRVMGILDGAFRDLILRSLNRFVALGRGVADTLSSPTLIHIILFIL